MANANRGLGKGLGALLGDAALRTDTSDNLYLPISQIEPYANQPRRHFDEEALQDLADSIREHGIIQPLTVRRLSSGYYQIIAGERRWRAARIAGLAEVPAIVIEADDRKMTELSLIENLQREDLDPIEEAEGYKTLMDNYHLTQEEAAERVGKSRSAVANSLRLLGLCPEVRQILQNGDLSGGHARALSAAVIDRNVLAARGKPRGKLIYNDLDPAGAAGKILVAYHSYFHSAASFKGDFSMKFKSRRTARYGHPDTYTPELGYA